MFDTNEQVQGPYPDAEESLVQLHGAGWSVVCTRFQGSCGPVWIVSGFNGENQVLTAASSRDEAWFQACLQARSVGMLGHPRQAISLN